MRHHRRTRDAHRAGDVDAPHAHAAVLRGDRQALAVVGPGERRHGRHLVTAAHRHEDGAAAGRLARRRGRTAGRDEEDALTPRRLMGEKAEFITLSTADTPHERARKLVRSAGVVNDRIGLASLMAEAVSVYMDLDRKAYEERARKTKS